MPGLITESVYMYVYLELSQNSILARNNYIYLYQFTGLQVSAH